jgi:hypothetical protein
MATDNHQARPLLTPEERRRLQVEAREFKRALDAFQARYGPGVTPLDLGSADAGPFANSKLRAVSALLRDDLAQARQQSQRRTPCPGWLRTLLRWVLGRTDTAPTPTRETENAEDTPADPTEFFDKYGTPIGRIQWVIHRHDQPYWRIGHDADAAEGWEVETVWVGFDPARRNPPMIFRSVVFHRGRRIVVDEYADSAAALDGHDNLVHCKMNNLPLDG